MGTGDADLAASGYDRKVQPAPNPYLFSLNFVEAPD